jgi:hypothetical protein
LREKRLLRYSPESGASETQLGRYISHYGTLADPNTLFQLPKWIVFTPSH